MDPGDAAQRAAEDAGVNQCRTLQQQKQRENQQPAANAIALAHFGQPRHDESEQQSAQRQQVNARQRFPAMIRRRLLQGGVQHQAEVNALEEIFGLQPAHNRCRSAECSGSVGLM